MGVGFSRGIRGLPDSLSWDESVVYPRSKLTAEQSTDGIYIYHSIVLTEQDFRPPPPRVRNAFAARSHTV